MSRIEIFDGKRKRFIGDFNWETRVFDKTVEESKHLFKKADAWGIDARYLTDTLAPSGATIRITDRETHKMYKVEAEKWKKYGEVLHFKDKDGTDNRAQSFLPRRYFDVCDTR